MSTLAAIGVGFKAARIARTEARARRSVGLAGLAKLGRRIAAKSLSILGLAAISAAAWTVAVPVGLLVIGLACFVIEYLVAE